NGRVRAGLERVAEAILPLDPRPPYRLTFGRICLPASQDRLQSPQVESVELCLNRHFVYPPSPALYRPTPTLRASTDLVNRPSQLSTRVGRAGHHALLGRSSDHCKNRPSRGV